VDGEEVVEYPSANIGIAVGLEAGLVVPVVIAVDRMSLKQLGAESKRIAELARKGKIEGMGRGIFTISNLGMFGVDQFTAIINPPEAAILAVSAVREEVIVKNGAMRPGKTISMTLSADHRLIDGVLAAKFMARLKEILDAPEQFLLAE
jgi:pyruvate dehydrogenase E2 component (dihydrolipoamide acetyltransferase)